MSLPLSEIARNSNKGPFENGVTAGHTTNDGDDAQTPIPVSTMEEMPPLSVNSNNSNSNNNTPESPMNLNGGFEEFVPHHDENAPSIVSDCSSVLSTKLAKYMKEGSDGNETGHEVPAWYLSPTPSPYHPPGGGGRGLGGDSSISVIEKMETEEVQYMNDDVFTTSHEMTSPPAFISPICGGIQQQSPIGPMDLTSSINTDSAFSPHFSHDDSHSSCSSHYQTPLSLNLSRSIDGSHYDYVKPRNHTPIYRQPLFRHRQKERDFAIEYTLQMQQRPEVVYKSDTYRNHDVDNQREHIYSHPRLHGGSHSGRNTPETPRGPFKVSIS